MSPLGAHRAHLQGESLILINKSNRGGDTMTSTWQTLGLGGFVLAATLAFTAGTPLAVEQSEQGKREMHEQMRNEMRQLEDKHEQEQHALHDKCKQDMRAMEDRHHSEREALQQKYMGSKK